MVRIEERRAEWVVLSHERLVSLHPSRVEAERAALWLARRAASARLPIEPTSAPAPAPAA